MQEEIVNKKSYNPFKMWGSWVGLLLYILIFISSSSGVANLFLDDEWRDCGLKLEEQNPDIDPGDIDYSSCGEKNEEIREFLLDIQHNWIKKGEMGGLLTILFINLMYIATLFLIGWGIHSLVRRLKK